MRYFVTWEIDVDASDATSPKEAAKLALQTMGEAALATNPESPGWLARCFTVDDRETGEAHHIDLSEED